MSIDTKDFGTWHRRIFLRTAFGHEKILESAQARKEYLNAIESRGLKIAAMNCSANAIGSDERWKSHAPDVMNRLAELLGVKYIVSQRDCLQVRRQIRRLIGYCTFIRPKWKKF